MRLMLVFKQCHFNSCITNTVSIACRNRVEVAQVMLDAGANINETTKQGFTPLHCAVRGAQVDIAKLLLDKGANLNIQVQYSLSIIYSFLLVDLILVEC